jgi:hypothetical protein
MPPGTMPSFAVKEFLMLTCSNCGATVREGAKFCTSCGTRLNENAASNATSVWATPSPADTSDTTDTAASSSSDWSNASATPPAWERSEPEPGSASSTEPEAPPSENDESSTNTDESFSWSWGSSTTDENEPNGDAAQIDEESGVIIEEAEQTESGDEPEPVSGQTVDATEVEILEDDQVSADADRPDVSSLSTSDQVDEEATDGEETETLAAWAEQWETSEAADEPVTMGATAGASSSDEHDALPKPQGNDGAKAQEDEEDTLAKAERLIGELRSIIPSLAQPRPRVPDPSPDSETVADDLEGAAQIGNFDDIRDALLKARDNPRDVDNILSLSGQVDRLLELLDDRNNLAKTAQSAATRLRSSGKPTPL